MGMKPRPKAVTAPVPVSAAPVEVVDIAETMESWYEVHNLLYNLEVKWTHATPQEKTGLLNGLALFLGGACQDALDGDHRLARLKSLVDLGYRDYGKQRNEVCQAVEAAHRFKYAEAEEEKAN